MDNPILASLAPSLLLVPAMGLLSRIDGGSPVRQEIRRKALHVVAGLVALTFPLFLTNGWLVAAALGLVVSWMLAVRTVPALRTRFGCVLHDAGRVSRGELYFALATAFLLLVARDAPVYYVAPLLILTLADTAAAIVGRGWPKGMMPACTGGKTVSGSTAFLLTACIITAAVLAHFTELAPLPVVAVSLFVAAACTVTEAASTRGLDNLTVPAIAWLILTVALNGA
jgi:phytol kinase